MNDLLVINFGDHMRKAQRMYAEGQQTINNDKTLSHSGKQLQMEKLSQDMQEVWYNLESQYENLLQTTDRDIKGHQSVRPLPTEPDEKTLNSERREF